MYSTLTKAQTTKAAKPARSAKPKKESSYTAQKISVSSIKELLEHGEIAYPVNVTSTSQILDIGHIVSDRPGFHTKRYIYPAGYKVTRNYASLKNVNDRVTWISEIIDTGDDNPTFKVYMQDDPSKSFEGPSPSSPWVQVLKKVSSLQRTTKANTISGPEAYLLTSPITAYLIQQLPGARDCTEYQWRNVE